MNFAGHDWGVSDPPKLCSADWLYVVQILSEDSILFTLLVFGFFRTIVDGLPWIEEETNDIWRQVYRRVQAAYDASKVPTSRRDND